MNNSKAKNMVKLLALLIILLSSVSYMRNSVWESRISLWADVIRKSPAKARAYNNAGVHYCKQKKYDQALLNTSKALSLDPLYADALLNRGNVYDEIGQPYKRIL